MSDFGDDDEPDYGDSPDYGDPDNYDAENGDQFVEVENQGYFSNLGEAFGGICFGIIMFIGAFPLLWWNEGRAVDFYQAINEGRKVLVPIDSTFIDSANEGELVYLTGLAEPTENITDTDFGVEVTGKIKLSRTVEMYQWYEEQRTETKKNVGGSTTKTTTYNYIKKFSPSLIDSSRFNKPNGHLNPTSMPYTSSDFSSAVSIGAFALPEALASYLVVETPLGDALSTDIIPAQNYLLGLYPAQIYPYGFYFGNTTTPNDARTAKLGDTRVTFASSPGGQASMIARQVGNTFEPYEASSGASLYRLQKGIVSSDKMFDDAASENKAITMVLRFVGALVMGIGIGLVLKPLEVAADIIPCIGDLVGGAITCVSFLIAAVLSLIVIGIAWVANRPIILGVGAAGFAVVGCLVYFGTQRKNANK